MATTVGTSISAKELIPAAVALIAGSFWVYLDGFTGETIAQVLTTLSTVAVLLVPLYRILGQRANRGFGYYADLAMKRLASEFPSIVSGPKFSRVDYVPNAESAERKYLFFQRQNVNEKAQILSLAAATNGVLEFNLSRTSIKLLGLNIEHAVIKQRMRELVLAKANELFSGQYEEATFDPAKQENLCVVLEFNDDLPAKRFETVVYQLGHGFITGISK
ncbi:MAG: hypothetical protein NTU47_17005 [Ignavibacteriales bacterium]|nr:hypothetical protein [Ignavibacteriales bacterium]